VSRVAVVTGAARGIGAATVRRLAADGWSVVAADRAADDPRLPYPMGTEAELLALAQETANGRVTSAIVDAADPAALAKVIEQAERRHGGIDAIVAAAGVIAGGVPVWEMPVDEQEAVLEANLGSVIAAARAGIPALLRRPEPRQGRFIAVASAAGSRGLPLLSVYCAAKAGVVGLVRGLSAELRGTGITANAVSPGSTRTPILEESARLYDLPSAEDFAAQHTIERLLDPAEIAAAIAWLASGSSGAVTGTNIAIDGGLTL
jgi:SDR family mycofactocin-dependent oxidoreductase